MKKRYYIVLILLLGIIFFTTKNYYDYKLDVKDNCVTKDKLDVKTLEYYELVYDSNGNSINGGYDKLRENFYGGITQNGRYSLYLIWNNEKIQINNYQELKKYDFPDEIIDRYFKNEELGKKIYMIVEKTSDNSEIFQIKRYQIYPYKKMINTRYAASASIMVQFKCALENNRKR